MVVTICLVTGVYLLPLAVSISLDHEHLEDWTDGHFTTVAQMHVGDWLSAWISLSGALSAVGLLNTLLCTAARVAASAAGLYVLPPSLSKLEHRDGMPRRATIAISCLLAVACALPFSELVSISMLFYGATTGLEFISLVVLRYLEPRTLRPYRIPLGNQCLMFACVPPLLLCALLIFLVPVETTCFFLFSMLFSTLTYFLAHGCGGRATSHVGRPFRRLLAHVGYSVGYGVARTLSPPGYGPCPSIAAAASKAVGVGFDVASLECDESCCSAVCNQRAG